MATERNEIKVATCSFVGGYDLKENLARHHEVIDEAADAGASLVVFPEISLHGYPTIFDFSPDRLGATFASAESVPDGPSVRELAEHAVERRIHVVYGLNEAGHRPGAIYNSAVLTGPEGHIGVYRKVHVHPIESINWLSGDAFPVFETSIGRIGIMICYDKWFPESARALMLGGADILVAPAAWGRGSSDPESSVINHSFALYDEVRALENFCWVVSSNYGELDGDPCIGMSSIVGPTGARVASTGPEPGLAVATVDVHGGIEDAASGLRGGHRFLRDRRPGRYGILAEPAQP